MVLSRMTHFKTVNMFNVLVCLVGWLIELGLIGPGLDALI